MKILKSLLLTFIFITICSYTFIDEGIRTDSEKDTYLVWFILLASGCQKPHQFCFFAQCPVQCIWLILFGDNDSDENYNIKASMSYMSKINHQIFKKGKSFSYLSFSIISLHSLSLASTSSTLPYLFPQFKGLPLLRTIFYFTLLCSSVYISSQDL